MSVEIERPTNCTLKEYENYVRSVLKTFDNSKREYELTSYDYGNGLAISEEVGDEVPTFFLMGHIEVKVVAPRDILDENGEKSSELWDKAWSICKRLVKQKTNYINKKRIAA